MTEFGKHWLGGWGEHQHTWRRKHPLGLGRTRPLTAVASLRPRLSIAKFGLIKFSLRRAAAAGDNEECVPRARPPTHPNTHTSTPPCIYKLLFSQYQPPTCKPNLLLAISIRSDDDDGCVSFSLSFFCLRRRRCC